MRWRRTLKPGLEALGATMTTSPESVGVSFPAAKMIDANGIDVSDAGTAAIKIIGETAKKDNAKVRIRARSSAAAPPKELRSLFHTAGEMNAVRAARVMSSLEHAGVAPAQITIVGDVEKGQSRARARQEGRRVARVGPGRARDRARVARCAAAGAWRCSRSSRASAVARPAAAYDFTVGLRTIGQGYQVRGFAADGSNELLSRRRLTQYMDLAVFDIAPPRWRGDDGDRNLLYFDASLRFDTDFGGYMLGRPTGPDDIHELQQSQFDILYAFLGGRNVGGRVDFQLGRQIHFDLVDFFAFDGGDALVHVTRNFGVEAYARHRGARRAAAVGADLRAGRHQRRLARSGDAARSEFDDPARWSAPRWWAAATAGPLIGAARVPADLVGDGGSAAGRARLGRQRREAVADRERRLAQPRLRRGRRPLQPPAGRVRRRAAAGQAADVRGASG